VSEVETNDRLPGEPPLRNWRPATTFDEYVQNCRDGLEEYSDRRAAKLLDWPRIQVYRAELISQIPRPVFNALVEGDVCGIKELAAIGLAFQSGDFRAHHIESCPHCGHPLRMRQHISRRALVIIVQNLATDEPPPQADGAP
jgi:hypothetical protein